MFSKSPTFFNKNIEFYHVSQRHYLILLVVSDKSPYYLSCQTKVHTTCRVRQKSILLVVSDKSPHYLSWQTKVRTTCRVRQKSTLLVVADKSPHYLSCQTKVHTTCRVSCECFALKTPELLAWKPLPHVETYKKNI